MDKLQARDPDIEAIYPASSLQQGFIYHAISQPDDDAYRVQLILDYHASVNVEAYQKAWQMSVARYPILRTYFNWEDSLIQVVSKQGKLEFNFHTDNQLTVEAIQQQERTRAFDLQQPTLLRLHLIKHHENHYTLIKSAHHSITDGWSGPLLLETVHQYYHLLVQGQSPKVIPDSAYHRAQDYIFAHKDIADTYWHEQLMPVESSNDLNPLLSRPTRLDEARVVVRPEEVSLDIEGVPYQTLKALTVKEGLTINAITQFAWHKLIQSYTQDTTTIVGTTISGRAIPVEGIEQSVGLYINTLPLIVDWNTASSIGAQLKHLSEHIAGLNEHSFVDLVQLQKEGRRLFHSLSVFENYPLPEKDNAHQLDMQFRYGVEKTDYPLTFIVYEHDNTLSVRLSYDGELLEQAKAQTLLEQVALLLAQLPTALDKSHDALQILSPLDYQQLIYDWNNTDKDYPEDKTLHQLFTEQAKKTPEHIALVYED